MSSIQEPASSSAGPDLIVACDLGGTNCRVALVDRAGRMLYRQTLPTEAERGPEAVIDLMTAMLTAAIAQVGSAQPLAVSISSPGPLDPWRGVIYHLPNLPGWDGIPLKDMLEERLRLPVYVSNDANAAALAEHRYGAGRGTHTMIYVTVSTGIGGGVVLDDRLLLGARGAAGELGHIVVDPNGPLCGCGGYGCVEALASGPAIARQFIQRLQAGDSSALAATPVEKISAVEIVEAASAGDGLARSVLAEAGRRLGIAMASVMNLLDPEMIVFGGGVSNARELIFAPMREAISRHAMGHVRDSCRIEMAALGDDVCLYGAAAIGFSRADQPAG